MSAMHTLPVGITSEGAEAVVKIRALIANGDLDRYWTFHLAQERRRNHQSRYQLVA